MKHLNASGHFFKMKFFIPKVFERQLKSIKLATKSIQNCVTR